jgi:Cu2+-exporting ATPase
MPLLMLEVAVAGGAFYAGTRAYLRHRSKPALGEILSEQRPAVPAPAPAPTALRQVQNAVQQAVQRIPGLSLPQDSHRQQFAELTGEERERSEREQEANHYLMVSLAALAISAPATLLHSPLIVLSVPLVGYLYVPFLVNLYHAFRTRQYRWLRSYDALVIGGELVAGFYFPSALASTIYFTAERLLIKAEELSQHSLINVFGQQPRTAWMLVDGSEYEVPIDQLKPGDIVVVGVGEAVPVDGEIAEGIASIDQHMLTGEMQPAEKGQGERVLASTVVLSGKIQVRVEQAGRQTTAARLGAILNETARFQETIEVRSIGLAERLIPLTLSLGLFSWPLIGANRALALLESSLGYNLRLSGPTSMLNMLQIAAQQGILIKDGQALELLHKIDTLIFDKTGTLTLEQPQLGRIYTFHDVAEETVLTWAAAAECRQTHPIARAILQAAAQRGLELPAIDDAHYRVGYGIQVQLAGHIIRVGSHRFIQMEQIGLPDELAQLQHDCHERGNSLVLVASDEELVGALELQPAVRPEATALVEQIKQRGLDIYIISGDHHEPTRRMAQQLGIEHFFAEVLPQDKSALVQQLQAEGRCVCFVGDGINDAIALQQADMSVSLRGATTAATDTAQVVLMDGSLTHLPDLLNLGREYNANMHNNLLWATIPGVVCIGGVLVLHWGLVTAMMIYNLSLAGSIANAYLPLLQRRFLPGTQPAEPPAIAAADTTFES